MLRFSILQSVIFAIQTFLMSIRSIIPSLTSLTIFFASLWLVTIGVFCTLMIIGTKFFQTTLQNGPLRTDFWGELLAFLVLAGLGCFGLFSVLLTALSMRSNTPTTRKT